MNDAEIQALVGALAPVLKGYVESAVAPVLARVTVLEGRAPVPGPKGDPGEPGQSGRHCDDAGSIAVFRDIARQIMEPPVNALVARIDDLEGRAPVAGPPGEPGAPGAPGRDAPALADLEAILVGLVKALPAPADGKDGVGLGGAMVDRDGHLVVTLTNGEHKDLGQVIGKDGANGQDGFSLEDFSASLDDDGRTVILKFTGQGKDTLQAREFRLALPVPIDRGVYKPGEYKRGDAVSWGGSIWIAQTDTNAAPESNDHWRLAVKRGRDGKDGVMKPDKPQGPVKVGQK